MDIHTADQLLVYMAMGRLRNSAPSLFSVRELSGHTLTSMALIEKMTDVSFKREKKDGLWYISV